MNLITNYEVDNEYIPLFYDNKYDKKSYNEIYNNSENCSTPNN